MYKFLYNFNKIGIIHIMMVKIKDDGMERELI